jgi:CSLREA domain-containing protein
LEPLEHRNLLAAVITVTTAADDETPDDGTVSLREAILAANANSDLGDPDIIAQIATQAGATLGAGDTIAFAIPGTGVHTITPATNLPQITDSVIIDGSTQPGASANTLVAADNAVLQIEINGATVGNNGDGLVIAAAASGSTVRGLVIDNGWSSAILVNAMNTVVEGNFLGTDPTGLIAHANTIGVDFAFGIDTSGSRVGGTTPAARNILSGNSTGIVIQGGSGQLVQGNFIGVDATGASALANGTGVDLRASNALVGGTTAAARNIIAGFSGTGIVVDSASSGTKIQGNFIGTDATGTVGLGLVTAIRMDGPAQVGGLSGPPGTGAGNVINASQTGFSGGNGLVISNAVSNCVIQGNLIGTDVTGTKKIGFTLDALQIFGPSNTVQGNVISGAGLRGILFGTDNASVQDNLIQANNIGTDITGTILLGNGAQGVLANISSNSTIANNIIAGNGAQGVDITSGATGIAVFGNSIFSNGGLGIDLAGGTQDAFGVTANDAGDADTGPNNLQNYPVLDLPASTPTQTTLTGTLDSTPAGTFQIEFFANAVADPSGFGEGRTVLGAVTITDGGAGDTNPAAGIVGFSFTATGNFQGQVFTATAMNTSTDETSEFSAAVRVPAICSLVVINADDAGAGSLRDAITCANSNPGTDTISFAIPGTGVHTISPLSALPTITDSVIIDGYTQPGASPNTLAVGNDAVLLIELNGTSGAGSAFTVTSPDNTFQGLVINSFPGASGDTGYAFRLLSAGNTIQGNYLGTNPAGDIAEPNRGGGISIEATSQPANTPSGNNLIGGATAAARNLILGGLQDSAIDISGQDAAVFQGGIIGGDGNTVQGNYIGTNAAGSAMLGRSGITIFTKNNIIGGTTVEARNVMFSSGGFGLSLHESNATGNTIQGNFIGINAAGTASLGGNTASISLVRAPNNTIGGAVAGAGNVISGTNDFGITASDSDALKIQGNFIGTNASGTLAVPNLGGIKISNPINNVIGGTIAAARNIISGNTNIGIGLDVFTASAGNLIQGNYIGTDITGTVALGNGGNGLQIANPTFGGPPTPPTTPNAVIVGGTTAGARNIISASSNNGILLGTQNMLVQGNYIGTDVNGTGDLGNGAIGIRIDSGNNNTIGGTAPGAGNIIAFSGKNDRGNTVVQTDSGLVVFTGGAGFGIGNAILGNSIFSNLRLGIDLSGGTESASGVTANDAGDADTGANNLQNYPVLNTAVSLAGTTTITGTLNSTPDTTFRIEFFASSAADPSGFGEGQTFLGSTSVTTDPTGNAPINFTAATPTGSAFTATATRIDGEGGLIETSEFSQALVVDTTGPTVTINQAAGQADPTNTSPIHFAVVFNEPVTDFATGDVTLSGTAGATTAIVTGSGTTYDVAVSGMTQNGTVIATLVAGIAHDDAGNPNAASTSTDNTVNFDNTAPSVTINQAAGQVDPTSTSPIHFIVVFTEAVSDFATGDVILSGTAGATTAIVTGSGTTYDVAVSGMTTSGTVIASLGAGVAHDTANNASSASTSTDNTVTFTIADTTPPTVTINQAAGQADPTSTSPIHFTVVFSETVTDFATGDVTLGGTAGATTATVTGSGTTYDVAVSGMTQSGTVIATLGAGVAHDAAANPSAASSSTDNTVTFAAPDTTPPTVTINQAAGQADPTGSSPIHFTVVFSEAVIDFATGDVSIGGSAGANLATVTGSGTTYDVAVTGMNTNGTVIATLNAGVAHDVAGNSSAASTSTDNTVTFAFADTTPPTVTINQAAAQPDPTNTQPIHFTVVFSENVNDFATGDVTLSGTAGPINAVVTGTGATYDVAVTGMTHTSGTVIATLAAGVAHDSSGNASKASTSTDNVVTFDVAFPTVTINQAPTQTDPTNTSPIHFKVVFSEPVSDFATGDVTLSGTAGATTAIVTGSGTTYDVAVSGMTVNGMVIAILHDSVAHDAAGNASAASTSTDNTVTFTTEEQTGLPECDISSANEPGASGTAKVQLDADNLGDHVLLVTGTSKNDVLIIEPRPANMTQVRVKATGHLLGIFSSSSFQHIVAYGLDGNDTIVIDPRITQSAIMFGGNGNDTLVGGSGNDQLSGDSGNDSLFGGNGNDSLCGDAGNDFLYGGNGNDTEFGEIGNDHLYGDAGSDLLLGGDGNDFVYGGVGNDQLFGQAGNDQLYGDAGNDILVGGDGNDKLYGFAGRDILIGGNGSDQLYGGTADDILIGDSTTYDESPDALAAVLTKWTANLAYNFRVNNLRSSLNSGTVLDDGAADTLFGDDGQDWFFLGSRDKVRDRAKNELTN